VRKPDTTPAPPPSELVSAIQEGKCIAFVGAGFSGAAKLPGWVELLNELAQQVEPRLRDHLQHLLSQKSGAAFEEAAQVLEDELGQDKLAKHLQSRLKLRDIPFAMNERLRWLHGIPFRAILTTNFDTLLQGETPSPTEYRNILRAPRPRWWNEGFWNQEACRPPVLKLHGDINHPNSVIFTRRSYRRRLHNDPHFSRVLGSIFAQYTILYLGFSFSDAYLNELRSEALAVLGHEGNGQPIAFAISNDVPERTGTYLEHHEGIRVISYSSHAGKDFSGFDQFLRALYESTSPFFHFGRLLENRRVLWLDRKPENNVLVNRFFLRAKQEAGLPFSTMKLEQVRTVDEAVASLQMAAQQERPFDLVITQWGHQKGKEPVAERFLNAMRTQNLRSPVLIFSSNADTAERRRRALALGAHEYCWSFSGLLRAIERVLGPGIEHEP
jgi:CheY-like chemotaxis protein